MNTSSLPALAAVALAPTPGEASVGAGSAVALVVLGLVYVALAVVCIYAYVRIAQRAGYSGWWVVASIVPLVNIVVMLMFAFREWPVQRELAQAKAALAQLSGGQPYGQLPAEPAFGQLPSAGSQFGGSFGSPANPPEQPGYFGSLPPG